MAAVKCFDVVTMVTDEATKQFGSLVTEDEEKKNILKSYCSIIDDIADRFNGVAFEVDVDDETADITISVVCLELEVGSNDKFYKLMQHAKEFRVSVSKDGADCIQMDFVFDGIWVASR